MVLEVTFKDGKATGTMTLNGTAKPISVETGGEVFAEGAGSDDVIATLPLAEGYQVIFRNFDLLKQKVALKQAKVLGAEEIKVPGGSAKAWKVEITSADGAPGVHTLWVAQDSRKVLKTSATLPEMGGAVISSELQP
ncbi:MAG: hypothetical protein IPN59_14525 [Holophaga sp.]|nr:hypothetical protein [Holophaga sp.]